jgi:hypothetical protein
MTFNLKELLKEFMEKGNVNLMDATIMEVLDQADENKVMGFVTEVALMNFFTIEKDTKVDRVRLDSDSEFYQDYPDLKFRYEGTNVTMEIKSRVESQKKLKTKFRDRGGGFPTVRKTGKTVKEYVDLKKKQKIKGKSILLPTDFIVFVDLVKLSGKPVKDYQWAGSIGKLKGKLTKLEKKKGESKASWDKRIMEMFKTQYKVSTKRPYWIDRITVLSISELKDSKAKLPSRENKGTKEEPKWVNTTKTPYEIGQLKFKHLELIVGKTESANRFMIERG